MAMCFKKSKERLGAVHVPQMRVVAVGVSRDITHSSKAQLSAASSAEMGSQLWSVQVIGGKERNWSASKLKRNIMPDGQNLGDHAPTFPSNCVASSITS
jgi:hypothetical protein